MYCSESAEPTALSLALAFFVKAYLKNLTAQKSGSRNGSSRGRRWGGPGAAAPALMVMGGSLFWGVGFTSYTAIMGHMGTDAAAANAVAAVIRDLICCVCNGVGNAAGIMVGNELGAGRLDVGKAYGIKLKNIS